MVFCTMTDDADQDAILLDELSWSDRFQGKSFSVALERRSDRLYLVVRGKLFTPPPPMFFDRLCAYISKAPDVRLCIELTGCEYLASPFYGMLAEIAAIADKKRMHVALVNPEKKVYAALCLLGFGNLFEVVEESAVATPSERLRNARRYRNVSKPTVDCRINDARNDVVEPFS